MEDKNIKKEYTKEEYDFANKASLAIYKTTFDNVLGKLVALSDKTPDEIMNSLIILGKGIDKKIIK